jgi:hypothetical protein
VDKALAIVLREASVVTHQNKSNRRKAAVRQRELISRIAE